MSANVLVVHGGGPTAVINASLYGVVEEARNSGSIGKVYGAIGGSEGILKEQFLDLMQYPEEKLRLLLQTPATAIGSSRYALEQKDYDAMAGIFKKYGIRYVLLNGGNGTMDTCGRIFEACRGEDIYVVGIPKTIDNDIAITDHTPGYGSAARFIAASAAEVGADVRALPIHVCVMEAMGRNAGWITANLVIQKLGIKARSEKPGLCGRASIAWQSPVDRDEAVLAGREALRAAMEGMSGVMIGLIRDENEDGEYGVRTAAIPIKEVMLHERVLPDDYINDRGNDVTDAFLKWCRPLIGPELREFVDFKEEYEKMGVGE